MFDFAGYVYLRTLCLLYIYQGLWDGEWVNRNETIECALISQIFIGDSLIDLTSVVQSCSTHSQHRKRPGQERTT